MRNAAVLKLQKTAPSPCSIGMSYSAVARGMTELGHPWGPTSPRQPFAVSLNLTWICQCLPSVSVCRWSLTESDNSCVLMSC